MKLNIFSHFNILNCLIHKSSTLKSIVCTILMLISLSKNNSFFLILYVCSFIWGQRGWFSVYLSQKLIWVNFLIKFVLKTVGHKWWSCWNGKEIGIGGRFTGNIKRTFNKVLVGISPFHILLFISCFAFKV